MLDQKSETLIKKFSFQFINPMVVVFFSSSKIKLFLYMYALYTLSERYREKIHSMKLNKYNRIKLVNGLVRDETSGLNLAPSYLKNNNYGLGVLFSNIRRRSIS